MCRIRGRPTSAGLKRRSTISPPARPGSSWPALEGGVLMQQEIGHGESCASVSNKQAFTASFSDGSSYTDPQVFQTCNGGNEGKGQKGEGPCNASGTVCQNAT